MANGCKVRPCRLLLQDTFRKSSINTPLLMKLLENDLFILTWNKAAIPLLTFLKRAIDYFGYQPQILQTDNGGEFTHLKKTDRIHPLDVICGKIGIKHKQIRPRTPRHNGKVERSHRNDQERFYNHMSFFSYDDLMIQMRRYLNRSNKIPMQVLGWKSPLEKRLELETQ